MHNTSMALCEADHEQQWTHICLGCAPESATFQEGTHRNPCYASHDGLLFLAAAFHPFYRLDNWVLHFAKLGVCIVVVVHPALML